MESPYCAGPHIEFSLNKKINDYVQGKIYEVILETVPLRRIGSTKCSRYPEWFTNDIKKVIKAKERARKNLKTNNSPALFNKYRDLRKLST